MFRQSEQKPLQSIEENLFRRSPSNRRLHTFMMCFCLVILAKTLQKMLRHALQTYILHLSKGSADVLLFSNYFLQIVVWTTFHKASQNDLFPC